MKFEPKTFPISDLVDLRKNNMLDVNQEYQRGQVWSRIQQQKLIDSLLRGYPIPLFYFHFKSSSAGGLSKQTYEIIDGQQRLDSIHNFFEGAWPLLDPLTDDKKAKFPKFVKEQDCPWAGKTFSDLPDELKKQFRQIELPAVVVETDNEHEVRDLFVRLQSGLPLNAQETRDSWPGDFTDFILWLGGKPSVPRYPGRPFFQEILKMKPGSDRGKTRQLAAQLAMIYFHRNESDHRDFPDIGASAITEFYYSHIDFDRESASSKRLVQILDLARDLLKSWSGPRLHAHDAIHLVALIDDLWDDYTPSWRDEFPQAFNNFQKGLVEGKQQRDSDKPNEFWTRYGQWTRTNSDKGERIETRHRFYSEKMLEWLQPVSKDPKRGYGDLERAFIYYRRNKKCDKCGGEVKWEDAELHHIMPHSKGGKTTSQNAALVHKECHPKSQSDVAEFAKKFAKDRESEQAAENLVNDISQLKL